MAKPTEFTLIAAKAGGWLVYVDNTNGRPDFAGTLPQCTNFIEHLGEPMSVEELFRSLHGKIEPHATYPDTIGRVG